MLKKVYLIAILCVFIDQFVKSVAIESWNVEKNFGAAFGLFQGHLSLLIFFSFLIISFLIYFSNSVKGIGVYGIALLLGGATSNLVDRMLYGYIVDYIHLWFWPSFNLADIFNVLGVILLVIYLKKK